MNLFLQTTFYKQNESNIILKSLNNTFIEGGFSMNLFHLRYFETLARTEHYSKAAEILSITQPSLSYAISTLESELGIQLFEKRGRNIVLTKYGKAFYSNVKEILANLDNAVRDIKLVANGEGEINIGFLRTLGTDYVPTTVKNFLDLHPDKNIWFNFSCEHGLSVDLVRSLIDREYDMVFCSKLNNSPMVEFIPIATQELVVSRLSSGIKADCARLLMTYSKVSMHTRIFFARLKKILSVPVLFPKASVL